MRNEKLRADLLRSISHDLRTPLTSVLGSAGLLADNADQLSEQQKHKLYVDIRDDAQWLLGTVENLLAVTRIEDGSCCGFSRSCWARSFPKRFRIFARKTAAFALNRRTSC